MKTYDARDLNLHIDAQKLKPLFKPKPIKHAGAMVFDWLIILGTIYFTTLYFHVFSYLLAVIIIGARMHAIAVLMHDATHYRFLKNRKWNDLITNYTTMYPLFLTIEDYRRNHLAHHQNLNTDEDPDWVSKLGRREFTFPKSKQEFLFTLSTYLVLYQGVKDAIWFVQRFGMLKGNKDNAAQKPSKLPKLLFYVLLIVGLSWFGLWATFLLFWVVPYFSTFLMFQYIRSVSEHFGEMENEHLLNASRTVKTNFLEKFLIAPHNVGYHIEHHLYPAVPFYNLPKLHDLLMENNDFKEKSHLTNGYFTGLLSELSNAK